MPFYRQSSIFSQLTLMLNCYCAMVPSWRHLTLLLPKWKTHPNPVMTYHITLLGITSSYAKTQDCDISSLPYNKVSQSVQNDLSVKTTTCKNKSIDLLHKLYVTCYIFWIGVQYTNALVSANNIIWYLERIKFFLSSKFWTSRQSLRQSTSTHTSSCY